MKTMSKGDQTKRDDLEDELESCTPREVLDGEWVNCWEALEIVEDALRDEAIQTELPAGQILARMAATGYLPTISNDVSHTVPKSEAPASYVDTLSLPDDERVAYYRKVEEEKAKGEGEWRLVDIRLWGAMFGFSGFENRCVHMAMPSFQKSALSATFTQEKLDPRAPLWEVCGDPGFYMMMARNILIYRDGLCAVGRYVMGWTEDDDRYAYNNLDLTQLRLPSTLPLAEMRMRRRVRDLSEGEADGPEQQSNGNSRGRPGGKNGEPIAALTIKLMQTDERTLAAYTAEAAGAELQSIYAMYGASARGIDNCRKDAAGVLRQVRGFRGLS